MCYIFYMLAQFNILKKLSQKKEIDEIEKNAKEVCKKIISQEFPQLDILNYKYDTKEAVEELGLDDELVHQLVEDYVAQIIKASLQFEIYIEALREAKSQGLELNYVPLRELVHKNLGVSRNLRIKDSQLLLSQMLVADDLDYLWSCTTALKACTIKIKPEFAYKTLKLIEVKSFL